MLPLPHVLPIFCTCCRNCEPQNYKTSKKMELKRKPIEKTEHVWYIIQWIYLTDAINKISKEESRWANEELLPSGSVREWNSKQTTSLLFVLHLFFFTHTQKPLLLPLCSVSKLRSTNPQSISTKRLYFWCHLAKFCMLTLPTQEMDREKESVLLCVTQNVNLFDLPKKAYKGAWLYAWKY